MPDEQVTSTTLLGARVKLCAPHLYAPPDTPADETRTFMAWQKQIGNVPWWHDQAGKVVSVYLVHKVPYFQVKLPDGTLIDDLPSRSVRIMDEKDDVAPRHEPEPSLTLDFDDDGVQLKWQHGDHYASMQFKLRDPDDRAAITKLTTFHNHIQALTKDALKRTRDR